MLAAERQVGWVAVVTLLPLLGFGLYLAGRRLRAFSWFGGGSQGELIEELRRETSPAIPFPEGRPVAFSPAGFPPAGAGKQVGGAPAPTRPLPVSPAARPPAAGQLAVVLVDGPDTGKSFQLTRLPVLIGRGEDADVRLDLDNFISRRHAEIYLQDGALRVRDLDSSHGIYVNGYRVQDMSLQAGDQLQVGSTVMVIKGDPR